MRQVTTEVLVIGGGSTGAGVAQDAAMRGFRTILVEKGDLTHGTTGRYHGLLHSGGRYAVKDPVSARECIQENRILRRIMPHCIEDTGGFFVVTPWDPPEYADQFYQACIDCGIPVEEISVRQALREEPLLNPKIRRVFRVPDAAADSFLATEVTARSAEQYGAQIWRYHRVIDLHRNGDAVVGARAVDLRCNEEIDIACDVVVNAAGAWAGQIAALAGVSVSIIPSKGTMVALNHRLVNTVINRCHPSADGDIIVPAHTVAVIGTTDVRVEDPDRIEIEGWEVRLMIEEGEKLVPAIHDARVLRAWAGVRPLYQEEGAQVEDTRTVSRTYALLDHEERDGVRGLITITGGKWTTYRQMAEVAVDGVCEKLGVQRPCRTAEQLLPAAENGRYFWLGHRLAEIEEAEAYGELVCECELVTRAQVEASLRVHDLPGDAIRAGGALNLSDVRRDTRLGMGPCQGGFCTYRAIGIAHEMARATIEETNDLLQHFLQARWWNLRPILWGDQLKQERLDELIYLDVLNVDHLDDGVYPVDNAPILRGTCNVKRET